MFTKQNASRYRAKRGYATRFILKTNDIARIFGVQVDTIRRWMSDKRLVLSGDPVKDFITLAKLARDKGLLD